MNIDFPVIFNRTQCHLSMDVGTHSMVLDSSRNVTPNHCPHGEPVAHNPIVACSVCTTAMETEHVCFILEQVSKSQSLEEAILLKHALFLHGLYP